MYKMIVTINDWLNMINLHVLSNKPNLVGKIHQNK